LWREIFKNNGLVGVALQLWQIFFYMGAAGIGKNKNYDTNC
jgi:hypothetical protein